MNNIPEIKLKLQATLNELNKRAQSIDNDLSEPADDDWDEEAVESAGDEVLEEVGEVTLEEIAQIKLALAQITAGRYDECTGCGQSIPEARLAALPSATMCVKCA